MAASALSTDTIISATNSATPPIRVSLDRYSEGDRITLKQGGSFVSVPLGDLDRLIVAALLASTRGA